MRSWDIYFGSMTAAIVALVMVPGLFGLNTFIQWGGMYVDAWCIVDLYSEDPTQHPEALHEQQRAYALDLSDHDWGTPQFSKESCVHWSQQRCGERASAGWTIAWVIPGLRNKPVLDAKTNVCALRFPDQSRWFSHAP